MDPAEAVIAANDPGGEKQSDDGEESGGNEEAGSAHYSGKWNWAGCGLAQGFESMDDLLCRLVASFALFLERVIDDLFKLGGHSGVFL